MHMKLTEEVKKRVSDFLAAIYPDSGPIDDAKLEKALALFAEDLTDLEERVLVLRYGLDGSEPKSLQEIAPMFGVTRERIRQIEAKCIRKLRHPTRKKRILGLDE